MCDILNLFYSFSKEIETVLSPMLLIIFVFSEVQLCLSTFRLAYVSDNCLYITRINNLIFISLLITRNLILLQIISPPIFRDLHFFKKSNILPLAEK
jgi:hypothetical protein